MRPENRKPEELVEDLAAGSSLLRRRHILDEPIVGKFLRKDEGAGGDALFDVLELLARTLEVRFGGAAPQRWTVADAAELEIELDAIAPEGRGGFGFSDRGVSGLLPGQYSNRRADIHEKAKT